MEAGGCVVRLVGLYHAQRWALSWETAWQTGWQRIVCCSHNHHSRSHCHHSRPLPPKPAPPLPLRAAAVAACRGAHTFFLRQGEVARWAGYTVNLIHYEDAASLCLAALEGQGAGAAGFYRGRTFLGCDGSPVTFEVGGQAGRRAGLGGLAGLSAGLVSWGAGPGPGAVSGGARHHCLPACPAVPCLPDCHLPPAIFFSPSCRLQDMMAATLASGAFQGSCTFTGVEGPVKGKRMSNAATRQQLQWAPKYGSYVDFMRQHKAVDWYSQQEAAAAVAGMPHA